MTKDNKCPFCGAERKGLMFNFACGQTDDWKKRSVECCLNQIAQLKERLEAWRNLWWHHMRYVDRYHYEGTEAGTKLNDLGEI